MLMRSLLARDRVLPFHRIVLDGEDVAHCPEGLPDFNARLGRSGCATACLRAWTSSTSATMMFAGYAPGAPPQAPKRAGPALLQAST
jgi:hypothetical protein